MDHQVKEKKKYKWDQKYMSTRDMKVLMLCFEQGVLTKKQIKFWLETNYDFQNKKSLGVVATRVIKFLTKNDYIKEYPFVVAKEKEFYAITQKGYKFLLSYGLILSREISLPILEMEKLKHDLFITDVRLVWENILSNIKWTSERWIRHQNEDQIPDGIMAYYTPKVMRYINIGIEIELTQKSSARYEKKFHDFRNKKSLDMMIYFAQSEAIRNMIIKSSSQISGRVYVTDLNEFLTKKEGACLKSHNDEFVIGDRFYCVKREM